jgi:hypothetical protein
MPALIGANQAAVRAARRDASILVMGKVGLSTCARAPDG